MDVTVIIPFRGEAATLSWVLEGFARQQLSPGMRVEVRVGGDGCTPPAPPGDVEGVRFSVMTFPWSGVSEAKNLLLRGVRADVVIFVNADTRPEPGFVAAHVARLESLPEGTMVLGAAPFETLGRRTVFDALKDQTPMIFFYCQMTPGESYDFRHAWTLNLSVRHSDLQRAGGFAVPLRPYGHEDIELAHRLMGPERKGIFYEPAAIVRHRHPMTFSDYLNREETLGMMAPVLRDVSPGAFEKLFGTRDVAAMEADYKAWVKMDAGMHAWIWKRMQEWANMPEAAAGTGDARQRLLMTIYQMHIPLKRLAFRLGFLRGLELRGDAKWQERTPGREWLY